MTYQTVPNPWDVASNPENYQQANEYFGSVTIDAWVCALVKGVGKVPYDASVHADIKPQTAINLSITPLAECDLQYDITRQMIGTFGDWPKVTWPSAKALGITNASELNGKFAHVEMVNTGSYQKNGETKDLTAIKFVQFFDTREECLNAYNLKFGKSKQAQTTPWEENKPANGGSGNGTSNEREVALKFARPLIANAVRQSGGDIGKAHDAAGQMIAAQAMIAKHFTIDSPEIIEMLSEELNK